MAFEKITSVKGVNIPKTKLGLAKMQALVEAAERLFTKRSFYETSISDICKEANTAVGTFYIYFESKTDLYRYLVETYKYKIKNMLSKNIESCTTRQEKEVEGIKGFIKYAVSNPTVYNVIWGSLAVDKQIFEDYYISFAKNYAKALSAESDVIKIEDATTLAYMLMGITNFLGLHAIFENMTDEQIDQFVQNAVLPLLTGGMFSK